MCIRDRYNGEVSAANEQQRYRYEYDSLGRVICSQEITNGALQQGTETLYDLSLIHI